MKINQRLEKHVKLAISQHNREDRIRYDEELGKLTVRAMAKVAGEIKRREQLMDKIGNLRDELTALNSQLEKKGYGFSGSFSNGEKVVPADWKKLGFKLPVRRTLFEDALIAQLLKANESEGMALLAEVGVVI